jgi:DNA-binding transcriptional ArsR family regulator
MNDSYPIASIAELIGDAARAEILVALLDGRALSAGELARIAGISAQSASGHLSQLVDGGLLKVESEGRHRYYRVSKREVAHAVEALGAISTVSRVRNIARDRRMDEICIARSCYDHLAGRVAVELTQGLETSRVIVTCGDREYELGPQGEHWCARMGVDLREARRSRRSFARKCLDWTERKPHLAGALGTAVFARFVELGWIARRRRTRALRITQRGSHEFRARFGINVSP